MVNHDLDIDFVMVFDGWPTKTMVTMVDHGHHFIWVMLFEYVTYM